MMPNNPVNSTIKIYPLLCAGCPQVRGCCSFTDAHRASQKRKRGVTGRMRLWYDLANGLHVLTGGPPARDLRHAEKHSPTRCPLS